MSQRPWVRSCRGYSQRTGKRVGERHRWPDGWGKGRCEFCGKYLEDVLDNSQGPGAKPAVPAGSSAHLEQALKGE